MVTVLVAALERHIRCTLHEWIKNTDKLSSCSGIPLSSFNEEVTLYSSHDLLLMYILMTDPVCYSENFVQMVCRSTVPLRITSLMLVVWSLCCCLVGTSGNPVLRTEIMRLHRSRLTPLPPGSPISNRQFTQIGSTQKLLTHFYHATLNSLIVWWCQSIGLKQYSLYTVRRIMFHSFLLLTFKQS